MIKLGNLEIDTFKVGGQDCSIYLGTLKLYSNALPPSQGKFMATYSNSTTYVLDCNGSTALTQSEVRGGSSPYSSMTTAEIGDCVTSIDSSAFDSCSSLSSVTIPSGVTSIGGSAFYGCSSLQSVTIPSGVTSIGISAFAACTSLSSVTIPNSVTYIGGIAFGGCENLTNIDIPSSVTIIDAHTFLSCSSLSSITIPDSVTSIGMSAFESCSSLSSITIPSGVTSIGHSAFKSCSSLSSITIPSGVTSIGNGAFSGCTNLTSFTCLATTPPTLSYNSMYSTNNCPIYVPAESVDAYKAASNWSKYASRIQAIPSPKQWVSVSADSSIPSGTVYDLRISSATTIEEGSTIEIEDDETPITVGNICEAECINYNEELEECMNTECTSYTLGWGITDYGSGIIDPINPLTFDTDGYWYLNAATNLNGFESDGETIYAPFDIQVLMDE